MEWNQGTAFVYPDHGRLWLTMQLLRQQSGMHLPRDARLLVEGVYGDGVEDNIPEALHDITIKESGRGLARAAMAGFHAIPVTGSYEADGAIRWQEESAPTRLGEPTIEWVLTSRGLPLNDSLPESTVRLRLSSLVEADNDLSVDVFPWQRLMSLEPTVSGYAARGISQSGKTVSIRYDAKLGLVII